MTITDTDPILSHRSTRHLIDGLTIVDAMIDDLRASSATNLREYDALMISRSWLIKELQSRYPHLRPLLHQWVLTDDDDRTQAQVIIDALSDSALS